MFDGLLQLFSRRPFWHIVTDVLDLIVVALLIYRSLLVIKGTRAVQMGAGIGLIFLIYVGARWLGLLTLQHLFSTLLSSFILIMVVVFQNDIRRALMRMGSNALFGHLGRALETRVVEEVVAATTDLARHRIGALIAFEQDANLDEFVVGQGVSLDASVSHDLLVTMFVPESVNKLHDGAVIIRNLRIAKAGVFFPMPEAKNIDASFGSRHRAALGITEETDAVVVVVSEERGTISFCFNGNIVSNLDGAELRATLLRIFGRVHPKKKTKREASNWFRRRAATTTHGGRVAIATPPPPRPSALPKSGVALATPLQTLSEPPRPRQDSSSAIATPLEGRLSVPMEPAPPSVRAEADRSSILPPPRILGEPMPASTTIRPPSPSSADDAPSKPSEHEREDGT